MARQVKLTDDKNDPKYQRERTNDLKKVNENIDELRTSPPKILKGTARYVWRRIVPLLKQMGYVRATDRDTIELLCMNVEMYHRAYKSIEEDGIQQPIYRSLQNSAGEKIGTDFVGYKKNPAVQTLDSATAKIKSLSETLGLTPASRAQLLTLVDDSEDSESLSDILNKKGDF
ncbi:phage terminase small subunit P27 family [Paucilactobacillus sp. N302-9]